MATNASFAWVTYAKAIGITLVVYAHVARGVVSAGIEMPARFHQLTDSIIYSFHMPLFFFLSGIFFFKSYESRGSGPAFALSKIDTLVYPYLLWSLLQGTAAAVFSQYTNGAASLSDVVSLLWAPKAQFWFLYALFLIFVLVTLVFTWVPKRGALAVFAVSVALYLLHPLLPANFVTDYIASNLVFFALGIVFEMYLIRGNFFSKRTLAALLVAAVLGQFLFHFTLGLTYTDQGLGSLSIGVVSLLLVVNAAHFISRRPNQVLMVLGSSSMAIFVMHVMAGSGTRIILQKFMHADSYVIHLVVGTLMGLLAPLVVVFLFRRLGIRYAFSVPLSSWLARAAPSR